MSRKNQAAAMISTLLVLLISSTNVQAQSDLPERIGWDAKMNCEAQTGELIITTEGGASSAFANIWVDGKNVRNNYPLGRYERIDFKEFGYQVGGNREVYPSISLKIATPSGRVLVDQTVPPGACIKISAPKIEQPSPVATPIPTPTPRQPGFESFIAIAALGLLALALRKRR